MKTRLAFDLSTVATGWAVGHAKRPTLVGTITPPKAYELADRLVYIADAFQALVHAHEPDEVVIEELRSMRGAKTVRALAGLRGCVLMEATRFGLPVRFITQGTSYNAVGLSGNSKKPQVVKALKAKGYIVHNDNEADAITVYVGAQL